MAGIPHRNVVFAAVPVRQNEAGSSCKSGIWPRNLGSAIRCPLGQVDAARAKHCYLERMGKLQRWGVKARLTERLVALPGMWDDLASWKRGALKLFAGLPILTWAEIRLWFVVSGTPWDQALLMLGVLALPITGYVIIVSGIVSYRKRNRNHQIRGDRKLLGSSAPILKSASPTGWLSHARAAHLIRGSRYFQYLSDRTKSRWGDGLSAVVQRALDENERRRDRKYIPVELLRRFEEDCSDAVRGGKYERTALNDWLQDQLDRKLGL